MTLVTDNKQYILNQLLEKVACFETQTVESNPGKRHITLQMYRGKDFVIMDADTFTNSEISPWEHYNSPGWIEFSFTLKGSFCQSQCGLFDDYLLSEGSHYFLFNPGAAEKNRLIGNGRYRMISIYMTVEKALQLFHTYLPAFEYPAAQLQHHRPFFHEAPHKRISAPVARILYNLWQAPAQQALKNIYYESLVNELFCWQWESLLKTPPKRAVLKLRDADIEKLHYAAKLLADSLQEQTSLQCLAQACQLNEYKLKAGFKEVFGATVSDYVQDLRMQKAQQLIRGTGMTMSEIAYDLGYTHSQHFQRAFKQKFGVTPGSMRET